jgi:hypothetical protein
VQLQSGVFSGVPFSTVVDACVGQMDDGNIGKRKAVLEKVLQRMIEKDKAVFVMQSSDGSEGLDAGSLLRLNPSQNIQDYFFGENKSVSGSQPIGLPENAGTILTESKNVSEDHTDDSRTVPNEMSAQSDSKLHFPVIRIMKLPERWMKHSPEAPDEEKIKIESVKSSHEANLAILQEQLAAEHKTQDDALKARLAARKLNSGEGAEEQMLFERTREVPENQLTRPSTAHNVNLIADSSINNARPKTADSNRNARLNIRAADQYL